MKKDNLVFGLAGVIIGLILGVVIANQSRGPVATVTAPVAQQTATVPQQQGTQQGQLPEGHPPIDQEALRKQVDIHKTVLEKDPENLEALITIGNLNYDMKNYPEAILYYEKAVKKDGTNIGVLTDLGTSYFYSNNPAKALEIYERSLVIDPKHFQTLMNIGVVKMSSGDKKGAADAWEKLISYHPDAPEAAELRTTIQKLREGKG